MNLDNIKKLLAQKESHLLEFKKSTAQIKGAFETLCGFLNAHGGTVLIGLNDKGEILGQEISDTTKQEIAKEVNKIEPSADVHIVYIPVSSNKDVIALQVEAGRHAPYIYDGRPFQRIESSTNKMLQHRYEQLLVRRGQLNHSWEEHISLHEVKNLDQQEIYTAINQSIAAGRIPDEARNFSIEEILNCWNLTVSGKLVNAAAILFSKNVLPSYSQSRLKIGRFLGNEITEDLADNRDIYGNAFRLFVEASLFISQHIPISSFFESDRYERIDKPLLPVLAIREALVNAICHRDYSARPGHIAISIFNNRLEIWNSGTLPHELKLDDLKRKHKSVPRNNLIARVFMLVVFSRGGVEAL